MRILSTFNDKIYDLSGKDLLNSIEENMPDSEVWVYHEVSEDRLEEIKSKNLNIEIVDIRKLDEHNTVLDRNKDIIDPDHGGIAEGLGHWNWRWFGWWKKILMQYDAIVRKRHKGTNLFLDADVRFTKPMPQSFIDETLEKPVGLFKGNRASVEAGLIVVDGLSDFAVTFYNFTMELFLNQKFRRFPRWDDSFILAKSMERWPHITQDLASNVESATHTNSNGHKTSDQVIPFTRWGMYVEHDKGKYLRSELGDINVPK